MQINNANDVMCMARAVVVGKCHADKNESETWKKEWNLMRRSNRPLHTREAKKLLDQANISHDTVCGIEEYKKIQAVLVPGYLIKVHSQHPKDGLIFPLQFKKDNETKVIHLYWNGDKHYDCIMSLKSLMGCSYYCEYCDVGYTNRGDHRCSNVTMTFRVLLNRKSNAWTVIEHLEVRVVLIIVNSFNLIRKNLFVNLYTVVKKCPSRIIGNKKNHVCPGQRKCKFCKAIVGPGHQCYIQKYVPKKSKVKSCSESEECEESQEEKLDTSAPKFVNYDFESTQET